MDHRLPTLMFALLLATPLAATDFIGGSAADQQRFREIQDTWVRSYLSGDLDTLVALLDEDVMIMAEGKATVVGKAAAREYFAARVGRPGVDFADDLREVHIDGGLAWVFGNFHLTVTPEGATDPAYSHAGRYFVIYRRNADGQWKVYRDIDNALPKPAAAQ